MQQKVWAEDEQKHLAMFPRQKRWRFHMGTPWYDCANATNATKESTNSNRWLQTKG